MKIGGKLSNPLYATRRRDVVWKQTDQSPQTKLRIYTPCVQSSLLHGADRDRSQSSWQKTTSLTRAVPAPHTRGIRWADFVTHKMLQRQVCQTYRCTCGHRRQKALDTSDACQAPHCMTPSTHHSVELLATLRLILAEDRSREDHGAAG